MRDAAINLRARPEQRGLIGRAAKLIGKSGADFMLKQGLERLMAAQVPWGTKA